MLVMQKEHVFGYLLESIAANRIIHTIVFPIKISRIRYPSYSRGTFGIMVMEAGVKQQES